jgi:Xaa-Pro dipeptidase
LRWWPLEKGPSDVPLEHGHVIRFDVGCRYLGYHADISRTASFGEPSKKVAQYCRAIEVGLDEAVAAMAPGVEASKVFQTAVEATRKSGIPHYRRHHVGHGIGLDIYEIPMLSPGSKTVLEEGMVFEVETPYYEIGLGGLQVEDTVVVLPEGAQRLNQVPARLMVVEV